jgi:hypothetical protein
MTDLPVVIAELRTLRQHLKAHPGERLLRGAHRRSALLCWRQQRCLTCGQDVLFSVECLLMADGMTGGKKPNDNVQNS